MPETRAGMPTGREAIDRVKARLDIVETVRRYVPALTRGGRTFKASCPFHQERTPSFVVDPERGSWHCFGACANGGDVIEFVRRIEGLDFREALTRCADLAGVELRPPSERERGRREQSQRLLAANESAALFFQAQLEGPECVSALAYAEGRGLDALTRREWQIGYAPTAWRALTEHLSARGYTDDELTRSGLARASEETSRDAGALHDRFHGRLIFPIRDQRGRLTAFAGRALGEAQQPKYLNTPRTPLFDKSATLYGLDRAAAEARRAGELILVEGYLDVIACWQLGIRQVAASMGTALTERQLRSAGRLTPHLVLALDADNAGAEATLRAVGLAGAAAGHERVPALDWRGVVSYQDVLRADIPRVASFPDGHDPDTLARTDPEALRTRLTSARPVVEHLFAVVAGTDLEDPRERSRAVEALAPLVATMADPVVRAHWLQRLARLGRISETAAQALVARTRLPRHPRLLRTPAPPPAGDPSPPRDRAEEGERRLLALLLQHPEGCTATRALDANSFEASEHRLLFETLRAAADEPSPGQRDEEQDDEADAEIGTLRDDLAQQQLPEAYAALPLDQLEALLRELASGLRGRRR